MSRNSPKAFAEHTTLDLIRRNLEQAEIRNAREDVDLPPERGLVLLLLSNATQMLKGITRTEDTSALERRIAEAHRVRAAHDCKMARENFRVVPGGRGVLS